MKYAFITLLLVAFFVYYFTRPAAAAIELTGAIILEADTMTFVGSGNHRAVDGGWALLGEGAMTENVIFKRDKHKFEIVAKGTFAGGAWPNMEVKIGAVVIGSFTVDSGIWKSFFIEDVLGITPGTHVVSVAFTNDFYEAPNDRNLYLQKVMIAEVYGDKSVTLAWDANTESDLAGYKIYYGSASRAEEVGAIEKWCLEHEPTNEKCQAEWEAICKDGADRVCHYMLFGYETVVDVKNVTEYQLKGLAEGRKYFLSATAYDTNKNESAFSKELIHSIPYNEPGQAKDMKGKPKRIEW
jgi:hypothetical protein